MDLDIEHLSKSTRSAFEGIPWLLLKMMIIVCDKVKLPACSAQALVFYSFYQQESKSVEDKAFHCWAVIGSKF